MWFAKRELGLFFPFKRSIIFGRPPWNKFQKRRAKWVYSRIDFRFRASLSKVSSVTWLRVKGAKPLNFRDDRSDINWFEPNHGVLLRNKHHFTISERGVDTWFLCINWHGKTCLEITLRGWSRLQSISAKLELQRHSRRRQANQSVTWLSICKHENGPHFGCCRYPRWPSITEMPG